jgi:hypothetical protein
VILSALTDYNLGYTLTQTAARLKKKTNQRVSPTNRKPIECAAPESAIELQCGLYVSSYEVMVARETSYCAAPPVPA